MAEKFVQGISQTHLKCALLEHIKRDCPDVTDKLLKIYWLRMNGLYQPRLKIQLSPAIKLDSQYETSVPLLQISESLTEKSTIWPVNLEKCIVDNRHQLCVHYNKTQLAEFVLTSIHNLGSNYGKSIDVKLQQGNKVFIHARVSNEDWDFVPLTELRTLIVMQFIRRILEFSGCYVISTHCLTTEDLTKACGANCDQALDNIKFTMMNSLKNLQYATRISDDVSNLIKFNIKQYAHDNSICMHDKVRSGPDIPVIENDGRVTSLFSESIYLEHIIQEHVQQSNDIHIYVSSQNKSYQVHHAAILWHSQTSLEVKPKMIHLVHGLVSWTDEQQDKSTTKELYRKRFLDIKKCFVHKYGKLKEETEKSDNEIEGMFSDLADFSVKFDLLMCAHSSHVKLVSTDEMHKKRGTFVMYGYARIASLLNSFADQVRRGVYPELPLISNINFTLLSRDEECSLIVMCGQYPTLIEEVTADLLNFSSFNPTVHKIVRFLFELSNHLNLYYNRVHILNEPVAQLLSTLFARIWLLKSIKQVMENIFSLLDIIPIKQM